MSWKKGLTEQKKRSIDTQGSVVTVTGLLCASSVSVLMNPILMVVLQVPNMALVFVSSSIISVNVTFSVSFSRFTVLT